PNLLRRWPAEPGETLIVRGRDAHPNLCKSPADEHEYGCGDRFDRIRTFVGLSFGNALVKTIGGPLQT
ncbi:hypothetical protein, partial [Nocardia terpenica]|uniref:hypothetical protein n=1 Tax=Nocardia terpenica TaxID=455432 RepID=UPI002FE31132